MISYIMLIAVVGNYAPGIFKKNLNYKIGSYGHMYTRVNEVDKFNDVDILFLGSSHSYRGFDPRVFRTYNYNIFNLGSSSQSPIQEELLLNQYLKGLNPKLIVFEVYPRIFESDGVESALDIIANNEIDFSSLIMCFKTNNIKVYNTLIYGYYRQLLNLNRGFKEPLNRDRNLYITGGFVENKIDYYKSLPSKKATKKYDLNKTQLDAFKAILKKLRNNKINFILVQAPISQSLYDSYSNNNEIDSLFNSLGVYYNFNEIISLKDSMFYDSHHLNQIGVDTFNHSFIDVLQKDNLLKK